MLSGLYRFMDYYNRDDYLSFGGESVKVLLRFVGMFYLKEFLSHYKFTPLACFLVKYQGHECIMIIGLFPRPVVCG